MGPPVVDWYGLALISGLIASGIYMVHSMTVTKSIVRVRASALVGIVLMMLFMLHVGSGG
jgi:hypothetical protein